MGASWGSVQSFTATQLERLLSLGRRGRFSRGQVLLGPDQATTHVLVLASGVAKVTITRPSHPDLLLGLRPAGEVIWIADGFAGEPTGTAVSAATDLEAAAIPEAAVRRAMLDSPALALAVTQALCTVLRQERTFHALWASQDAAGRLAARLVELEQIRQRSRNGPLWLTQQELASWAGVTRSSAARALRMMRTLGWISTSRREIIVHDLPALKARATGGNGR
jgi:CRP/FNR family cyclic AMP-dependent transcriptional regulator